VVIVVVVAVVCNGAGLAGRILYTHTVAAMPVEQEERSVYNKKNSTRKTETYNFVWMYRSV
jgi:hypothetical protein